MMEPYQEKHQEKHIPLCICPSCHSPNFSTEKLIQIPMLFKGDVLVGSHVPFSGSFTEAIKWGLRLGMYTIQLYMGSQQSYSRSKISNGDIESAKALLAQFPSHIFTHSPVIYNLAGSVKKKALAWTGNVEVDGMMEGLLKNLNYELSILNQIGAKGTVIHPGCSVAEKGKSSHELETEAIEAIGKTLSFVNFTGGEAKVLLENSAGEGGKVAYNLENLARIRDNVEEKNRKNIAFCFDTAHCFGAGLYDLRTIEGIVQMFSAFDFYEQAGRGKVDLIHLNDSDAKFGACRDLHACLGTGHIWKDNLSPLIYLLKEAGRRKIPLALETSPSDMGTLYLLLQDPVSLK